MGDVLVVCHAYRGALEEEEGKEGREGGMEGGREGERVKGKKKEEKTDSSCCGFVCVRRQGVCECVKTED